VLQQSLGTVRENAAPAEPAGVELADEAEQRIRRVHAAFDEAGVASDVRVDHGRDQALLGVDGERPAVAIGDLSDQAPLAALPRSGAWPRLVFSADVLQAELAAGEFLALLVGDGDEPELLGASLLEGLGQDVGAAGSAGA
jgi:hypothetical protein